MTQRLSCLEKSILYTVAQLSSVLMVIFNMDITATVYNHGNHIGLYLYVLVISRS